MLQHPRDYATIALHITQYSTIRRRRTTARLMVAHMTQQARRTPHAATAAGAAITDRMADVGLGQTDLAALTAVSVATIRALQQGTPSRAYRARTLRSIERALQWPSGHIDALLDGTTTTPEPPPVPPNPTTDIADLVEDLANRVERIERALENVGRFLAGDDRRVL